MGEKVKVSREIAVAIEGFLDENTNVMKRSLEVSKGILIAEHCGQDWARYEIGQYLALNDIDTFTLMQAMVNGYEVRETPEEKALAYYNSFDNTPLGEATEKMVIRKFLNTAEIKFKGIND